MPVKFIEAREGGRLGFWEITETTGELLEQLAPAGTEWQDFLLLRNELRKQEWLATRLLLREIAGNEAKIEYDPTGKPLLKNAAGNISISHSSHNVTVYFHPAEHPGIDIEPVDRDAGRAARKFLSPGELADCTVGGQLSNPELMLRWCAKEAAFKMIPESGIDFAGQLACRALPFDPDGGNLSIRFTSGTTALSIPLRYRCVGRIVMVWGTLPER